MGVLLDKCRGNHGALAVAETVQRCGLTPSAFVVRRQPISQRRGFGDEPRYGTLVSRLTWREPLCWGSVGCGGWERLRRGGDWGVDHVGFGTKNQPSHAVFLQKGPN